MSRKVLGNLDQGLLFVISAPAGTGKSTLVEMLLKEFPHEIAESCSCTTRHPRPLEKAGEHYHFLSIQEFERRMDQDEFAEHAKVFGHYYGTLKEEIEHLKKAKKHVLLVIDTQGAMQIRHKMSATFIFISPPSEEALKERLFRRSTEDQAAIEQRLQWAKNEMNMIDHYDYHIINEHLDVTYQVLKSIIIAEEHRRTNGIKRDIN